VSEKVAHNTDIGESEGKKFKLFSNAQGFRVSPKAAKAMM
jgi:hypothetical protein